MNNRLADDWADRVAAVRMDAADPLGDYRAQFAMPQAGSREAVYLLGNSLGLMPLRAPDLVAHEMDAWKDRAVNAHFIGDPPWLDYFATFRATLANLVGATPDEVTVMNALTVNLHLLMASFYAPVGTRTKIVMEAGAFPSDRYAVLSQLAWHGLDESSLIEIGPTSQASVLSTADVCEVIERRGADIALVMLSGVQYYTGQRFDIPQITECARHQGCVVGWDLAHAAGNVPLAMHDWNVDFAAWCSYKYLNAGPGAVSGCFIHERHFEHRRRLSGWWGSGPEQRFKMESDFVPAAGADGWQISNPPILSMAALRASLAIFADAGWDRLQAKAKDLTNYLERLVVHRCGSAVEILTPTDPVARGCQLSLRVKGQRADKIQHMLESRGIVTDFRAPDVVRAAPVPLYNSYADAWDFADALRSVIT